MVYVEARGSAQRTTGGWRIPVSEDELADIRHYLGHFERDGCFPLFTQVQIETRTDCNRSCSFCPQSVHQRPLEQMEWATYEEIVRQLVELGFSGRIAFFMTNEPLLDERLVAMVAHARQASGRFFLDLNTNGNLLDVARLEQLFVAGLDNINIEDYRTDRATHPDRLSKNIAAVAAAFGSNPKITLHRRSTGELLTNRAGNVPKAGANPAVHSFCNFPFRKISLAPSGDVVLCCMDYRYQTRLGNAGRQRLAEIWNSDAMNRYRLSLLKRARAGFCAGCDVTQYPLG